MFVLASLLAVVIKYSDRSSFGNEEFILAAVKGTVRHGREGTRAGI